MYSFWRKLNYQITNQNEESGTSLFNKVSGIAIAISILLAVLETESHIEIQFGELIRKIDLVIGFLFCIEYVCRNALYSSAKEPRHIFSGVFVSKVR